MPHESKIDFRKVEIGLLVFAVIMIGPSLGLAILYPVKGIPLYGKFIGMGAFALFFYWGLRRQRRNRERELSRTRIHPS